MWKWLTDFETRRVLKLRWRLFWLQKPFWYESPYRVVLVLRRRSGPWANYWTYVCQMAGYVCQMAGQRDCEIGPESQWSMEQAIDCAREMWQRTTPEFQAMAAELAAAQHYARNVLDSLSDVPEAEAEALDRELLPAHRMNLSLQPLSNYRIQCTCGWFSAPTLENHLCLPANCENCRSVEQEWEQHVREAAARERREGSAA